jgi:signal peptidase II
VNEEPDAQELLSEEEPVEIDLAGNDRRAYVFWLLALLTVLVDQTSKAAALELLDRNHPFPIIPYLFELRLEFNRGAAFSVFVGGRWIFVAVSLAAVIFLPMYLRNLLQSGERNWLYPIGLGLILGGAMGNAIDRVFREQGMVVDFFHAHWRRHSFPVFNIADSAITIGLGVLLLVMFLPERITRRSNES